jgi:amino acid adenylation domain-containing protein
VETVENLPEKDAELSPTKQALAQTLLKKWLRGELPEGAQSSTPLKPLPREGALPLSYAQERMYFLDLLRPGSAFYNMYKAVELSGPLSAQALSDALLEVERRHEPLRATFRPGPDGLPTQVVAQAPAAPAQSGLTLSPPPPRAAVPLVDLSKLPEAQRRHVANALTQREAHRPFDLKRGPLLRATLLKLGEEEHVLLLAMHHIISDGWSMGLLVSEISSLYASYAGGQPSPLGEPELQYADYAAWQREWLQGENLERQLSYWRGRLAGAPALMELPADRPRPAEATHRGGRVPVRVGAQACSGLLRVGREGEASLFMALLAALKLTLSRSCRQRDVVVGTRVAGRVRPELEGLVGLFVNAVALRTEVDEEASFRELLRRVRETALGAFDHQDVPFERLVSELRVERVAGANPVFNVMFVLHQLPPREAEARGLRLRSVEVESATAKYDLDLTLWEDGGGVSGWVEYSSDLFDREGALRLARRFERACEQAAARPDAALRQLEDLPERELWEVTEEANRTRTDYEREALVPELFARAAAARPDAVAVCGEGGEVTYAELRRQALRVGRRLRALGVGAEEPVGVLMPRDVLTAAAVLGVFEAGGVYVPLDVTYPEAQLRGALSQSGARVLLTTKAWAERARELGGAGVSVLLLDDGLRDVGEGAEAVELKKAARAGAGNLAYVMYTSGSTAEPKGVAVEQRQLLNRLHWMWREFPFGEDEVLCQRTGAGFSVSMWELLGGILSGCRTAVVGEEEGRDVGRLVAAMEREAVTRVVVVPSLLKAMLEWGGEGLGRRLSATRLWSSCGEPLALDAVEQFGRSVGEAAGARLVNQYGASEVNDSAREVVWGAGADEGGERVRGRWASIGRPIDNLRLYVLDEGMRAVGAGVTGDLYVGSESPARCYVGRAAETAERFVPDPYSEAPGARLYRTGDVARRLRDGRVEHLGRADGQAKVRGMRVELKGVEAALLRQEGVREAAVVAREGEGGTSLAAYVVWREGERVGAAELRSRLRAEVSEQMVPAVLVELERLPLLPNGKVDRRALPEPSEASGAEGGAGGAYAEPRTPAEELIAGIWREVLGAERVGVNDNFFDLGGHSLLAIPLVSRVNAAFNVDLPLRRLFESPTVAALAVAVSQHRGEAAGRPESAAPLPQVEPDLERRHQPFPLTHIQQAYWVGRSEAFELGNVAAHSYLELEGDAIDLGRLEAALNRVIARHDMLRAVVLPDGQQQILEQVPPYRPEVSDLSGLDAAAAEASLAVTRRRMSHQVLPSDRWPLFEVCASRLPGGRVRLHVSFDLLFSDAWSWQLLARELTQFYWDEGAASAPLELSFRDYVLAERSLQDTEAYRRSQEYWQRRLETLPPAPDLPLAQNPGTLERPRFMRQQARLEAAEWKRLQAAAQRAGLTPSGLLLAAFSEVLTVWSKSPHFTLNLTLFNRHAFHPQVNQLVGDFTSLNLLEVDNTRPEAFGVRARALQERLWDDLDHRYVSGVQILRELSRARGRGQRATMPVVFTSTIGLGGSGRKEAAPRKLGEMVYNISQTPQVWIDHQVHEHEGALVFNWDAVETLFPAGALQDMFAAYCSLLARLAESPESWQEVRPPLVPAAQLEARAAVNATDAPLSDELLHTLFNAQAEARGPHPAVVAADRTLSFAELSSRSNRVGRLLREAGARPNELVAVVMEKGWGQAVGALGVLQSGAAYLPVAPSQPAERLRYLLEHSEVRVALTQSKFAGALAWPAGVRVVAVDDEEALAGFEDSPLEPAQRPDDLAYVIYTSGSTGLPKGVMIDHRGAVNTILDLNRRFGVTPHDRVLALSSLSFDLSVYDIFGLLAAGGTVVIPDPQAAQDPAHWAGLTARERVTVWNSVPALMKMLVEYLAGRGERLTPSLRLVMLSGDWLPVNLPGQVRELSDGAEVYSLGGATEASIWSILYPVGEVGADWKSIPYGRPMVNQRFHVLDEWLEPRPVWVPGQLYIGGVGLARGYWGDEEKTRASFFTHPRTGERLYRTGDWGRYLPGGDIEFLGREDFQVKVQGYRIELGEIEAALLDHDSLGGAVVAAVGEARGEKRLVAYVVPAEGAGAPTPSELRAFLKAKLPEYMVPSAFHAVAALPLTSNGKVDRKALAGLVAAGAVQAEAAQEGAGGSVEQLGRIVAEYLKVERLEPEENLLDMGASSVDMIRIANLLEKEFGFRPRIDEFYREPTLKGLAHAHEQFLRRDRPAAAAQTTAGAAVRSWEELPFISDPAEREEFKRRRPGLRGDEGRPQFRLPSGEPEEKLREAYRSRRTHRHFSRRPAPLAQFSELLGCLRQLSFDGEPKYLYPSAGGIYPVQTYVHVKARRVEGLPAGTYYYDPAAHRLVLLAADVELPSEAHDAFVNRPVFEEAAFSIFLVGQMAAVAPIYGRHSLPFATLEAGYLGQLLMMTAPACGLGLCPVGVMNFDLVRQHFALDESHVLVHSLLGGLIDDGGAAGWAPVQESYDAAAAPAEEREEFEL